VCSSCASSSTSKWGKNDLAWFKTEVEEYVRYLEQEGIKIGWDGEQKYNFAFVNLRAFVDKLNILIDEDAIKRAIEAYVQVVNAEQELAERPAILVDEPQG
jgi:hypothetical protein